jgi:hypothetical protein
VSLGAPDSPDRSCQELSVLLGGTNILLMLNSNTDIKYPRILVVNILPYRRIEYITLEPILESKASINSNYYIIENIFLD